MHSCWHTHMHAYMFTQLLAGTPSCMFVCGHTGMHSPMHECTQAHACARAQAHTHTCMGACVSHTWVSACVRARILMHKRVHMRACAFACIPPSAYIHIHECGVWTHMHAHGLANVLTYIHCLHTCLRAHVSCVGCVGACRRACAHAYRHTSTRMCPATRTHTYMLTSVRAYILACGLSHVREPHACMPTYFHTLVHACVHDYLHAYLRLCQYSPYRWYAQSEGKYISYACPLLSSYSRTLKMSEPAFENPFKRHPTLSIWRYRWQLSMGTRVSACLYIDTHTRLIVL
jgi:hypothetical protein